MLCGLLRNPGFGIKPQAAILGGDGVSVRKDSALVVSSDAATPPPLDGMEEDEVVEEEEDKEVTSASGAVCTFGVSTASSASMRKFLDFSIWLPVRCASLRLLQLLRTVNGVESCAAAVLTPLKVMMWSGVWGSCSVSHLIPVRWRRLVQPCGWGPSEASWRWQRLSALVRVNSKVSATYCLKEIHAISVP